MPLARMPLMQGKAAGFAQKVGAVVYRALAERLHNDLGVRKADVLISLVEVKKEDWSFGNGVAQYAEEATFE